MSQCIELEYDDLPAVIAFYARAAIRLSDRLPENGTIPPISAHVAGLKAQSNHLARYREVCSFPRADTLPITYPHVWAFPLQMAVLTHKQFPLKLLGLVHVRNEISQLRPVANDEVLDIKVRTEGHRDVRRGIEFDLITELTDQAGHIVWEETGTMLSRRQGGGKAGNNKREPEMSSSGYEYRAHWDVAANIGRRYAGASGDYNPIHLSMLSARLFGFRRAIATGMWLKARVAAELTPQLTSSAYTLGVSFRKPVFLPGPVSLGYNLSAQGASFSLTDPAGDITHLQGQVSYR